MPEIAAQPIAKRDDPQFNRVQIRRWQNMTTGDKGAPVVLCNHADRTIKVGGDFGGNAKVLIEGFIGDPNDAAEIADDANWLRLTDPSDNFLEIAEAKIEAVSQMVLMIRPRVVDGTNPLLTVYLLAKE